MNIKITVIGVGRVGTVAAASLAVHGHHVLAVDADFGKIQNLQQGITHYEPGLAERVATALKTGRLRFAHLDDVRALDDVVMVTVNTPDGAIQHVHEAVDWIKERGHSDLQVVMKSSVPPGTGDFLAASLADMNIGYAANPEFLRMGTALANWDVPERIVIGSHDYGTIQTVKRIYGRGAPVLVTDITSAEMVKYASNAFMATRISFINEIALLCKTTGANIEDVSLGISMDGRTGKQMHAGVGYGGSCLSKDINVLEHMGASFLPSVIAVNKRQRTLGYTELLKKFGDLNGIKVGVLGLAFKPETDDVHDAPALDLVCQLLAAGAEIAVYDPKAMDNARKVLPPAVNYARNIIEVVHNANALAMMTEWDVFANADWKEICRSMSEPRFVFDGRNMLQRDIMESLGFEYVSV